MFDTPTHERIVSIEGISGSGKSYLLGKLFESGRLSPSVVLLGEISNRIWDAKGKLIFGALQDGADAFLRSGHPGTETQLLFALKTLDYEARIAPQLETGGVVVEDRSVDTIAVYQAAVLGEYDVGRAAILLPELLDLACRWRPAPTRVLLLLDDFETSVARAEARDGRKYRPEDLKILECAYELYQRHAAANQERVHVISRRSKSEAQMLEALAILIEECVHAPAPRAI